jgi:ElaB/YqjD/DUF883 family membrane-anchored ribosome-binding protein
MNEREHREYYISRQSEILALFGDFAQSWKPFILSRYGDDFTETTLREAREQLEALIPEIPYIGGDENSMTRHLVRSVLNLALYQAMKARGKTARETGRIVYDATVEYVRNRPFSPVRPLSLEAIQTKREQARKSQERRYAGDWVWEFIEGTGQEFDYGYDFIECGTQKLYHDQDADAFLPFYCFLDFVTTRTSGQNLMRSMTLATGDEKCDFRFKPAGTAGQAWPPPFPEETSDVLARKTR